MQEALDHLRSLQNCFRFLAFFSFYPLMFGVHIHNFGRL